MTEILKEREEKIRSFFQISNDVRLLREDEELPEITPQIEAHLQRFNIEWHIIPAAGVFPGGEEQYRRLFYPRYRGGATPQDHQKSSSYRTILNGHRKHQGRILGIETTTKPRYLPHNHQFYGTPYGFESTADPFAQYFGPARFVSETRYGHNYVALREFVAIVNRDWQSRGLMPKGYRLTICPPVVFNLIGTIFHSEWSQTESLELGFYRDENGNAKCFAVGSNAPGDFSYLSAIDTDSDWTLLGFRTALVPDGL